MSVDQRGVECLDVRVDRGVPRRQYSGVELSVDIICVMFSIQWKSGVASTMRVEFRVDYAGSSASTCAWGAPTSTSRCSGATVGESYKCVRS